ncbi:neurogenic locus notch homolog protein 1 [Periophthalmus magnuspinnatus]|uniref:neurogenic locus notch homolog protein 1 n=1 Tax=Periophthalmus magnuspinnatus TaxID=409849 RepID=UPI00145B6B1D|nr:neurogenic locus notch homolog protein 1 [Periophthalmus magnuspinnatus]
MAARWSLRTLILLGLSWSGQAVSSDPWGQCPVSRNCKDKFGDGACDKECKEPECLRDGFDCVQERPACNPGHIQYCRNHYGNSHCDRGCDSAPCGWDGGDCMSQQTPVWAKGTLLVHTRLPLSQGAFTNSSVLWALSVVLQSPLKLRGATPFGSSRDLFHYGPGQLEELLTQATDSDANGSLLALQVDNRPCSSVPSSCFPYSTEAASFLRAVLQLQPALKATLPELQAVISLRGLREELGTRDQENPSVEVKPPMASWMWAVVAVALALLLLLCVAVLMVMRRVRQRAHTGGTHSSTQGSRSLSMSTRPTKTKATPWGGPGTVPDPRIHSARDRDKLGLRKKKKAKEAEKRRRREPLGEDAMRMRPLRREQDIGSDTDVTQSSMEDIASRCTKRHEAAFICDHRSPGERAYRGAAGQGRTPSQAPPRGWERNAMPPPLLSPPQHSAEWCGPDGSVVLIRAVRSGLDRVVLELLRAGVPVNNTDHTGRSALHWACSVNHLSLARTLIRYGAAVDLQDNKGETALFLSALHGCYDTARLLLLHGANLDLRDRRGRHAVDAAQEGMHHQILEMLLSHQMHRRPAAVQDSSCDVLWDDRGVAYPSCSWGGAQGLPGRSASFSGTIGALPPSDWSPGRVQYPSPHTWRPQINQSTTALVPPRIMGRSPRPISTLQEVTSEDEDRERPQDVPRPITPHFLSPQPAPRQRSFSCTQHALQRRPSAPQPEPNYVIVTPPAANEYAERTLPPPSETSVQLNGPAVPAENLNRAEAVAVSPAHLEQKNRERPQSHGDPTQTAL